ncbi:transglycosylase SLT domain-containing protein [Massilia sp. Root418]|uniref:transglycosylase SLT domain-containing protein n=1 Tax=Massilia sp. Root418 TaxID=1736532 RepID=UPI0009E85289|nr:transglycosylase SLT domain-containing protein [Massilia sp. Root418]
MTNRFTSVANATRQLARAATGLAGSRVTARSVLTTAQHTLTVFGVSALVMIAVLFARPDLAQALSKSLLPQPEAVATVSAPPLHELMEAPAGGTAAAADATPLTAEEKAIMGTRKQQEWVTSWLSKRYRVAGDATNMLVSTAYLTAREIKLDPLLILAVMAIESGLNPFAESPMGAQGLMQVMSKIHHEKFQDMGGVQAALNPVANIRVGSLILKDYVTRGGSVEAGLKTYVGAAAFETDDGYGSRVLAEYKRLKQVSAGKKVPTTTPVMAAAPSPAKQVETAVAANTAPVTAAAKLPDAQLAGL